MPAGSENINRDTLVTMCVGAAKYFANEYSAKVPSVLVVDQEAGSYAMRTLATCPYSPDNGGLGGNRNWTWYGVAAADRTTTENEKKIAVAWDETRGQYQKDGLTDEDAPKKAIARKYKMKVSEVALAEIFPHNVAVTPELEKTPAISPAN